VIDHGDVKPELKSFKAGAKRVAISQGKPVRSGRAWVDMKTSDNASAFLRVYIKADGEADGYEVIQQ